jgi:hypothetical protein
MWLRQLRQHRIHVRLDGYKLILEELHFVLIKRCPLSTDVPASSDRASPARSWIGISLPVLFRNFRVGTLHHRLGEPHGRIDPTGQLGQTREAVFLQTQLYAPLDVRLTNLRIGEGFPFLANIKCSDHFNIMRFRASDMDELLRLNFRFRPIVLNPLGPPFF